MGNHISSHESPATGKVILVDGSIHEFDKPLTVAELMLEYPQQVVVDLKEAQKRKPTALPADNQLEVHKIYVMVPLKRGKPAHLSPQEAHHILLRANTMLRSKTTLVSSAKYLPFFARVVCPAGIEESCRRLDVSREENKGEDCEDFEGIEKGDNYMNMSRQLSGRSWKPSLDTIEEKKNEIRKGSNWVLVASKVGKRIHSKGLVWG